MEAGENKLIRWLFGSSKKTATPVSELSASELNNVDQLLEMSQHYNGHRREAAIRRLAVVDGASAIPVLLVRVNDWVPQVRQAARQAFETLLVADNVQALVEALPLLFHLQTCERDDHSVIIGRR